MIKKELEPAPPSPHRLGKWFAFSHDGQGFRIWVDEKPDSLQDIIQRTGDFYEAEALTMIRDILPPAATIVDVGANIGNHAIFFDRVCKARKVFVIEPNEDVIKNLIANTTANGCRAVDLSLTGFAVGAESGSGELHISPSDDAIRNRGGVSVVNKNGSMGQSVPVRRLDDLELGDVNFLKIDVERNALDVLAGASELLRRCRPLMLVEVDVPDLPAFTTWMTETGYSITAVVEHHEGVLNVMLAPLSDASDGNLPDRDDAKQEIAVVPAKRWAALDVEKRRADRSEETLAIAVATMRNSDARAAHAEIQRAEAELRATRSEAEVVKLRAELEEATAARENADANAVGQGAPTQPEQVNTGVDREQTYRRSVFFRPNGRPKKTLRRILFHTSGRPRGVFKKYVLKRDGTPRKAFAQWMTSAEYMALPDIVRRNRPFPSIVASPAPKSKAQKTLRFGDERKRVFFVDSVLPDLTRDSGSVDTINYVTWLTKMKYEVLFLSTSYGRKKTSELPVKNAGAKVIKLGSERDVMDYIHDHGAEFDLFFLSRVHSGGMFFEACRRANPEARVIFNTVDLHFLREEREARLRGDNVGLFRSATVKERELYLARQSDVAIVVSHAEKEIIESEVPGVTVAVMPLFRLLPESINSFEERRGIGFIGGFTHSPNVDALQYFLAEVWPLVKEHDPSAYFEIAGPSLPSEIANTLPEGAVYRGQVPDLEQWLGKLRLTVAPLRYGAGAKGKVASSVVNGVPVIGTSVAFEGMGLGPDAIVAADSPALMAKEIIRVHGDKEAWTTLSRGARDFGTANLSPDAGHKRFEGLLSSFGD